MKVDFESNMIIPSDLNYEVVERKGLGHPDTLADGIAESIEIAYCKYCLKHFGVILHHNFDKLNIEGGLSVIKFGQKEFKAPIRIEFLGRATLRYKNEQIPLKQIQVTATKKYLKAVLPNLNVNDEKELTFDYKTTNYGARNYWFNPKSEKDLPEYTTDERKSNDTAAMVGYWPLTPLENLVKKTEEYFYKRKGHKLIPKYDFIGQDIKVMGIRSGKKVTLTVCIPQITSKIRSFEDYMINEKNIKKELYKNIKQLTSMKIKLIINSSSNDEDHRPYLTTTGSCIDFGEEGAVGRGNKVNGIIAAFRPNTMEAPHGKNSVYFVGKVLGYSATQLAKKIYFENHVPCQVIIESNSGDNLFNPQKIIVMSKNNIDKEKVEKTINSFFNKKEKITSEIINSQFFVPNII